MSTITSNSERSDPDIALEDCSRGSSVSSGFINEYEEILKYAIVAPKLQMAGNVLAKSPLAKTKQQEPDQQNEEKNSLSKSNSSTSSSSSSNLETSEKDKQAGQTEVRMMRAKRAVNNYRSATTVNKSFGGDQQLKFLTTTNAMDDLLETPKVTGRMRNLECSNTESPESLAGEIPSPSIDKDLVRMDAAMDDWCLQLKRNVLNELADMKKRQLLYEEGVIEQLKAKHNAETLRLAHEVESLKELLYTFEQNVKQKDEVINNLTNILNKQKERSEKIKLFSTWRLKHNEEQRQGFAMKMADKFYKRALMIKVWIAWRSVVESTWKKRVEKACQIKSQEVCLKLTQDYEERLQALHRELSDARTEVAKLHTERESYEENMKKAFMRGVCALNMEAMSMFKEEQAENTQFQPPGVHYPCVPDQQLEENKENRDALREVHEYRNPAGDVAAQLSHQSVTSMKKSVRFAETAGKCLSNQQRITDPPPSSHPKNAVSTTKKKNVQVKMTGKRDYSQLKKGSGSQSSSISSVKVERHTHLSTSSQQQSAILSHSIPSLACTRSEVNNRLTPGNNPTAMKRPITNSVIVD